MSGAVWLVLGIAGGIVAAVLSDLFSEEARARLDQLPRALVLIAVRLVSEHARPELRREWLAELHEYLHGHESVPITRLAKGIWFSAGLISGALKTKHHLRMPPNEMAIRRSADLGLNEPDDSIIEAITLYSTAAYPLNRNQLG